MAKRRDATPKTGFFSFPQEWEELLFQTKLLAVVSSLGHLSIKNFSDRTNRLGSKIKHREGAFFLSYLYF